MRRHQAQSLIAPQETPEAHGIDLTLSREMIFSPSVTPDISPWFYHRLISNIRSASGARLLINQWRANARAPYKDIKRQSPRDQLGLRGLRIVNWFRQPFIESL
jgi:hypothetical protein